MLNHSQPWITESEEHAALTVLRSNLLGRGEAMSELELELAKYLNKKHALFTGNGSQAQALILAAMDLKPEDEVIVPSYVCEKVYAAVEAMGATPVLCDIGENWVMTPEETSKRITSKTRAIILPHVYGLNAWSDAFLSFGIPVVEDICQSLGHISQEHRTGTKTDHSFTSFHGTKCIGAGEGGMLFVNDENLFAKIQTFRKANPVYTQGTDVVAAIALSQYRRYSEILQRRNEIAEFYNQNISEALNAGYKKLTKASMHYRYILRSHRDFDSIRSEFFKAGIHVRKGVDNLIHRKVGLPDSDFPNSVHCYNTSVSIPILPQFSAGQIHLVAHAVSNLHSQDSI